MNSKYKTRQVRECLLLGRKHFLFQNFVKCFNLQAVLFFYLNTLRQRYFSRLTRSYASLYWGPASLIIHHFLFLRDPRSSYLLPLAHKSSRTLLSYRLQYAVISIRNGVSWYTYIILYNSIDFKVMFWTPMGRLNFKI